MININLVLLRICLDADLDLNEIRMPRQARLKTIETINKLGGLAAA
jgi:hypothetical protein